MNLTGPQPKLPESERNISLHQPMQSAELEAAWDTAAEAIEEDAMRLVRYGKCLRYLVPVLPREASILEVGCGEGTGLLLLREFGFTQLTGVEVSTERLRRAAAKLPPSVSLCHVSPAGRLPFTDGQFDAVITAAVLEHTVDPESFVRELARVTRPGGNVVVSSDCYSWRILKLLGIYQSRQPIDRALLPWTLRRHFEQAKLDLIHCEGFPLPGEEYRFLGLLFSRPRLFLARVRGIIKRMMGKRQINHLESTSQSIGHTSSSEEAWLAAKPISNFQLEPFQSRPFWSNLPILLFSDETVFFLRKGRD